MKLEDYLETEKLKEDFKIAHRNVALAKDETKPVSLVFLYEGEVINRMEFKAMKELTGLPCRMKLRLDGKTTEIDQDFEDMIDIYHYFSDNGRGLDSSEEIIAIVFVKGKE